MIHNTIQLAQTIPGLKDIFDASQKAPNKITNLGGLVSSFINIMFYAAIFLAFYFLVWGAFAYIMAQGKKEDLAKARDRITWALIGLIIILLSFFIASFVTEILKTNIKGGIPF